jgi:integrase/recombinase XerD
LFERRKRGGATLAVATQAQRLIPVTHFFTWLPRSGRVAANPASDLLMPKSDRPLPEATLTSAAVNQLLTRPNVSRPLGLRDRAVLEVFYSWALRRGELINLMVNDVDFARGTVFVRSGKGAKDRYVPIGNGDLPDCSASSF